MTEPKGYPTEYSDYQYWMTPKGKKEVQKPIMDVLNYIFVYGTLLNGEPNYHNFLGSSFYLGPATTKDMFVMFDVGFPLTRPPNNNDNPFFTGQVKGEVYGVTDAVLKRLDQLEGHPNFYERRVTDIEEYPNKKVMMYQWIRQDGVVDNGWVTPDPTVKTLSWRRHLKQGRQQCQEGAA